MPAIWAAGIAAVGSVASASMTQAPDMAPSPFSSDPYGMFDHSSWTVATGKASATATRTQTETTGAELSDVQRMVPWLAAALVGIVAFKAWAKK